VTRRTRIKVVLRRLRKKHVSFVVAPSGTGRARAFRLSLFWMYITVAAVCVFAGGLLFVSLRYADRQELTARLSELERRADVRTARLAEINAERAKFQKDLAYRASLDDNLRVVHDLAPVPEDVRNAGVGGPLANITHMIKVGRDKNVDELELALRQAQLQYDSFKGIIREQERARHIFDHTPSVKPCGGRVVSGFSWRRNPIFGGVQFHKGLDIAFPTGAPIIAPADGVVKFAGMKGGYGYCVFLKHGYGFETRYGYCSQLLVKEGQRVKRGDIIAFVGATGWAVGPHVHYEVLVSGTHVDPAQYILPDYLTD